MTDYELVVSPGKLPFWSIVLAAVFGASFLYFAFETASLFFLYEINESVCYMAAKHLKFICFCFAATLFFATQKTVLIDVDKNLLISEFNIGPIVWRTTTAVPSLEYVSFFKVEEDVYHVNLWYERNRHYKMYAFDNAADAQTVAKVVAGKLRLDVLDATRKGDSQWIEPD